MAILNYTTTIDSFKTVSGKTKNPEDFRAMNCDDCQCNVCLGSCMACYECYRAEYAEEHYEDFYVKDTGQKECVEI